MDEAILATEVFGFLALINVLYGICFESNQKNTKTSAFVILIFVTMASLIVDGIQHIPVDWTNHASLFFCLTVFSYLMPFLFCIAFLHYLYLHILAVAKTSRIIFSLDILLCILGIPVTTMYSLDGSLFVIENGKAVIGEYYEGYLLLYAIIMVYTEFIILMNCKKIGIHDVIASSVFIVIPMIFVTITIIFPAMDFAIASVSLSVLVVNTMLQSEKEHHASSLARSDKLTGLQNRLLFSETLKQAQQNDQNVGVVYADLNGLKYTNDNFGHKAGDALLCDFAQILLSCYRKDDIFRISGDEFVVLPIGLSSEGFEQKYEMLNAAIQSQEFPIAATGKAFGRCADLSELVDRAERQMYENKKRFHETYPQYSRV